MHVELSVVGLLRLSPVCMPANIWPIVKAPDDHDDDDDE
jgi:hypothetical protein